MNVSLRIRCTSILQLFSSLQFLGQGNTSPVENFANRQLSLPFTPISFFPLWSPPTMCYAPTTISDLLILWTSPTIATTSDSYGWASTTHAFDPPICHITHWNTPTTTKVFVFDVYFDL